MTSGISTNDGAVQTGGNQADGQLQTVMRTGPDGKPIPGAVDPRLTAAADDTDQQNRRGGDKVGDGIRKTKDDSAGKTAIDEKGSDGVSQLASLATAFGTGAQGVLGSVGQLGSGMQMPSMPQVPASSAGQSNPSTLSSPAAQQALAKLLGDDSTGAVGSGSGSGLTTPGGSGGGSGSAGPSSGGSNAYEKKIIDLANQVVGANIPYAWGGGGLDGPSQGTTDNGGGADAAGDYNKVGYDCSGLARYLVYQASGVEIPRTSGEQFSAGQLVSAADARPGDLAFDGNPQNHVMIYVGDGKVCEAQMSGTNIMFSDAASRGVTQYVRVVSPQEA